MRYPLNMVEGVGIGLRTAHINDILSRLPDIPWLEVLTDNFLAQGGINRAQLQALREHYPITLHGVGLSLGGVDPLNQHYLAALKQLDKEMEPAWISDHACFSSFNREHFHDLLPLPYTEEAVSHLVTRIQSVQDYLGRPLLIENVSRYLSYTHSTMTEGEFLAEVIRQSDCYLLLDVNNAYINEINHGYSCTQFFDQLPLERVKEVHLAGFERHPCFLLDAHNSPVAAEVWQRYRQLLQIMPYIPTLIEWDNNLPDLDELLCERVKAQQHQHEALITNHRNTFTPDSCKGTTQ